MKIFIVNIHRRDMGLIWIIPIPQIKHSDIFRSVFHFVSNRIGTVEVKMTQNDQYLSENNCKLTECNEGP